MSTYLDARVRIGLALVTALFALASCQRTTYPSARVDEPDTKPPYSVQANPNAAPQNK